MLIMKPPFLMRFLTFQLDPVPLYLTFQSCRYVRTPLLVVYPDVKWALHLNYDMKGDEMYFQEKKVPLVEGYADYMSYIGAGVDWLHQKNETFSRQIL